MSDTKELIDFVVGAVREVESLKWAKEKEDWKKAKEEQEKVEAEKRPHKTFSHFKIVRTYLSLVEPCRARAKRHREREQEYTKQLEEAEKELREKGVTVDATDPNTGFSYGGSSGPIASGAINIGNCGVAPKFGAKVDPIMLAAVEKAKTKMLEHRGKAEEYEKLARAFACADPEQKVELSTADINFFRLEA